MMPREDRGAREAIRHKIQTLVHVPPPSQPCAGNSLAPPWSARASRPARQIDLSRDRRAQFGPPRKAVVDDESSGTFTERALLGFHW
jgi:hypothetical protein